MALRALLNIFAKSFKEVKVNAVRRNTVRRNA
jgi:hypothetical protein